MVKKLGVVIDPETDTVMVNGRRCVQQETKVYIALNKPRGYVCTHAQFRGEKSVFELLPEKFRKLKIAGRLDKGSEGLVLLSNDGDFIYRLTHPKFKHTKEYEITLDRQLGSNDVERLKRGVRLKEGSARADNLKYISGSVYHLILHQGWKRQIRRMFELIGYHVLKLQRVREGKYAIGRLQSGKYREVKKTEVL